MSQNIFIIGLDDSDLPLLQRIPGAEDYAFHSLIRFDQLRGVPEFPVKALLEEAESRLQAFDGPIALIGTYLDFPAEEITALLIRRHGLRGPTLEQILTCTHKYWNRLLQRDVEPDHVPKFATFDPFDPRARARPPLPYPFWVKPLNAFRSHLGFRIDHPPDFERALVALREGVGCLAEPLKFVMDQANLPDAIAAMNPSTCLAEEIISGSQCTLEGYVFAGQPEIYGVIDSVREPNRSTFARYQYPSTLPRRVTERMVRIAENVIRRTGLNDCAFNMEFFHDPRRDRTWILEVNPRLSRSHCDLFEKVDGVSHQKVMIDIGLGRKPAMPRRQGRFKCAAKFFMRADDDAWVERVPSPCAIAQVEQAFPGAHVEILVEEGTRLSDLSFQESYSYELATVYLGAHNPKELLRRFRECRALLPFRLTRPDSRRSSRRDVDELASTAGA